MAFLPGIFGSGNSNRQSPQQQQPQPQHPNDPNRQPGQGGQPPAMNNNGSGGPAGSQNQPANSQYGGGNQPGQQPGNGGNQQDPQQSQSPLDPFMQLMTPSKDVQTDMQQRNQQQSAPLFGDQFNPENINKAVGQTNFAQNLDPQKVQAALGGDANAFMEVLNSAIAAGVSTSIQASRGMVEHGVNTGTERFGSNLDSRFRDYELNNQTSKNPALQHPLGKSLLKSAAKQIAQANPRMSASEVNAKAEEMFSSFAQMMNPAQSAGDQNPQSGSRTTDWEAFLDESNR